MAWAKVLISTSKFYLKAHEYFRNEQERPIKQEMDLLIQMGFLILLFLSPHPTYTLLYYILLTIIDRHYYFLLSLGLSMTS